MCAPRLHVEGTLLALMPERRSCEANLSVAHPVVLARSSLHHGLTFSQASGSPRLLNGIAISVDGKGRWMGNVFIGRLWRSVKYEEIHRKEHVTLIALRAGLRDWFKRYNGWRPHASLGKR